MPKELENRLNETNEQQIKFLVSDFKKKNGYKKSIELAKKYNLYRQDYCGCLYGKILNKENENYEYKKEENHLNYK